MRRVFHKDFSRVMFSEIFNGEWNAFSSHYQTFIFSLLSIDWYSNVNCSLFLFLRSKVTLFVDNNLDERMTNERARRHCFPLYGITSSLNEWNRFSNEHHYGQHMLLSETSIIEVAIAYLSLSGRKMKICFRLSVLTNTLQSAWYVSFVLIIQRREKENDEKQQKNVLSSYIHRSELCHSQALKELHWMLFCCRFLFIHLFWNMDAFDGQSSPNENNRWSSIESPNNHSENLEEKNSHH